MNTLIVVPNSARSAGTHLRQTVGKTLSLLPKRDFVRAWCAIAYLYPGLHPEGYDDEDSGWPRVLKPFAAEAWRRACADELSDAELFVSDAAWAGIFDQGLLSDDYQRRLQIATDYGEPLDA